MPTVLVVEDNTLNAEMLTRLLRRDGYSVEHVLDGRDALEKARSRKFDLILMDLGLPEVDGWEATRRLKADPETRDIPVIALTAHAGGSDVKKALEAGCDHYETKPLAWGRLKRKMRDALGIPHDE